MAEEYEGQFGPWSCRGPIDGVCPSATSHRLRLLRDVVIDGVSYKKKAAVRVNHGTALKLISGDDPAAEYVSRETPRGKLTPDIKTAPDLGPNAKARGQ